MSRNDKYCVKGGRKKVGRYISDHFIRWFGIVMAVGMLFAGNAPAQSGNWNTNAGGNWSVPANWSCNPAVPGTNGLPAAVVGLTRNITDARTITNDCAVKIGRAHV